MDNIIALHERAKHSKKSKSSLDKIDDVVTSLLLDIEASQKPKTTTSPSKYRVQFDVGGLFSISKYSDKYFKVKFRTSEGEGSLGLIAVFMTQKLEVG